MYFNSQDAQDTTHQITIDGLVQSQLITILPDQQWFASSNFLQADCTLVSPCPPVASRMFAMVPTLYVASSSVVLQAWGLTHNKTWPSLDHKWMWKYLEQHQKGKVVPCRPKRIPSPLGVVPALHWEVSQPSPLSVVPVLPWEDKCGAGHK